MCHLNILLFLLSSLFYHEINAFEQYGSKACWKRTIIRYDSEKGVVSKLRQIPICCKGWREFNETTCTKAEVSGYPFQDTKIAKSFLKSKRTKRSWLKPELVEECKDGSCSYEEADEHNLNRRRICEYFKQWKCSRQNCPIGQYCDTQRDTGCRQLSQYVVTCKDCEAGNYGNSCKNRCNCQIKAGYWKNECNKINGTCYCEDGYTGVNCTERCKDGFFGSGCNKNCFCQHDNSCNPVNGICNCTTPGWKGKYCEQPCESGTYGVGCQENCTCPANSTCNRINGDCVCNSGLRGHNCSEEFTFGEDFKQQCTCVKNSTRSCDPVSGIGYCKKSTESNCTSTLDITTQQIFEDQEPQGSTSQQDKINIIIAAVTLGTLMVSVIIIITVVYKRKNGRQTMPTENVYAELNKMSQPLSQEYMYEDLRSRNYLEDPKSLNQHQ